MDNCVLLLSGGPDSASVLAWARKKYNIWALHFNYGQINAERERVSAKKFCNHYDTRIEIANIEGLREIFLDKIGDVIDYNIGCWEVLPFMLGFPISLAASYGLTIGALTILLGVHKTDVEDHPEYRVEALEAFQNAIALATNKPIEIIAPFISKTKAELIKYGSSLDVPYEKTWSCLLGGIVHCGRCWGCARRKNAFHDAQVPDPTEYDHVGLVNLKHVNLYTTPSRMGLLYPNVKVS